MRLLHLACILGLLTTGAALVWRPLTGWLEHERSRGRILEVIPEAQFDGRVRLRIAYEFEVPGGDGARHFQLGWGVADAYFRPIGDPLIVAARAEGVIRALLDTDEPRVRSRTVFYRAADPAGTAFILDETAEQPSRRLPVGVVLLAAGLTWILSLWLRRD